MASIDKIYGTVEQYDELLTFFKRHRLRSFIDQMYPREYLREGASDNIICSLRTHQDGLLLTKYRHEVPEFALKRILYQYGYRRVVKYIEA